MEKLKKFARTVFANASEYHYHNKHKKEASYILGYIETEKGKTSKQDIKLCNEYANDILGGSKYAPWLYVYTAISNKFNEGWIPDNYYGKVVAPLLNADYKGIDDRNILSDTLLNNDNSLDICYFINDLFILPSRKIISSDVERILFKNRNKLVYKIENSLQGKGVYFFEKSNFDLLKIKKIGNGVFQNYIQQHPFFNEFMNSSVSTIRITSFSNNDGDIIIKAAYLRIGRNNDTHVKSASAIRIPIDIINGNLYSTGYFTNWTTTKNHPDSNVLFKNKTIPSFSNCILKVKKMHSLIPFVRCVGWDIIVDKNNKIILIEWNCGHNDIKFSEATQGPCFKGLGWENLQ